MIKEKQKCSFKGCQKSYYAKGYCHNCYERFRKKGYPEYSKDMFIKCEVESCTNQINLRYRSKLCEFHQERKRSGVKLDRPYGNKGKNNPRWNGGISEYPNHYLLKKIRPEVLKKTRYTCQFCGAKANQVHHRDRKDNHSKENLVVVCRKCIKMFREPYVPYRKLCGLTRKELKKMGLHATIISIQRLWRKP